MDFVRGVDTFVQDVRYGCRLIGRSPMLSAAIVLTLAALAASQALRQLFKSAPIPLDVRDPVAYLGVAALLTLVALCAMLPPAWRAASSDPVHALRED
jgi:ABC-type lipoprotein release transport system permease subunit